MLNNMGNWMQVTWELPAVSSQIFFKFSNLFIKPRFRSLQDSSCSNQLSQSLINFFYTVS